MLCSRGGLLCLPDQLHFVNTVLTARLPSSTSGIPLINLSNMSSDGKPKTLVIVDRHVVITDHFLRAKDDASKKEALKRLTASGSIRLAVNADYFKA